MMAISHTLKEKEETDKLSVKIPYNSYKDFKRVASSLKSKLDEGTVVRMFMKANMLLHMPELTRTDYMSIGDMVPKHQSPLEKAVMSKLKHMLTGNLDKDKDAII
jgi:hypothetical protein